MPVQYRVQSVFTHLVFSFTGIIVSTTFLFRSLTRGRAGRASHLNPLYHFGLGRIVIKLRLPGESRLIFFNQELFNSNDTSGLSSGLFWMLP